MKQEQRICYRLTCRKIIIETMKPRESCILCCQTKLNTLKKIFKIINIWFCLFSLRIILKIQTVKLDVIENITPLEKLIIWWLQNFSKRQGRIKCWYQDCLKKLRHLVMVKMETCGTSTPKKLFLEKTELKSCNNSLNIPTTADLSLEQRKPWPQMEHSIRKQNYKTEHWI